MGTRGFITFVVNGEEKTTYNHFDSYPSGLGAQVADFLQAVVRNGLAVAEFRERVAKLRVVKENEKPTAEDKEQLAKFTDLRVSNQSDDDWYCLLRNTQGDVGAMLEAGVITDAHEFPEDSLFAEWGYVINLDGDGTFEVYRGFQTSPHDNGRFAGRWTEEGRAESLARKQYAGATFYYPCALVRSWPLATPPTAAQMGEFEAELCAAEEGTD